MAEIDESYLAELAKSLIRCPSVTPAEGGALDLLESVLSELGFSCRRMIFSEAGTDDVDNLFARLGTGEPYLAFAGHTDVVPAGDEAEWSHPPFAAEEKGGIIYGRGAVDMKGAIACWIAAVQAYVQEGGKIGSVGMIITGDEEGVAVNGTVKMLTELEKSGDLPSACITGEPTSTERIGDTIKHGRRGSINFNLTVMGKAGHTGYPHLADNAAHKMVTLLHELQNWQIDAGNEDFQPSHLSVTQFHVDNQATNVIPAKASARMNIRFNNLHTAASLTDNMHEIIGKHTGDYELEVISAFEAFLTPTEGFCELVKAACKDAGVQAEFSTKGGTSDSRFIKNHCDVLDLGLIGATMHQTDEAVSTKDLLDLSKIYYYVLNRYFG